MKKIETIDRRMLFKTAGITGIGLALGKAASADSCSTTKAACCPAKPKLSFNNADFYDSSGNFIKQKGIDAYCTLMEYHGYPVLDKVRKGLWVSDYGLGTFTELGLGAFGFINHYLEDRKSGYLGQDMFLLPNQMLPQHYHLKTDKAVPKMEGWHVRHGRSYVYGEGEPTKNIYAKIPESQKGIISTFHEVILDPGMTADLNRETAPHWQFGGPEGAIISEYGSYHDNDAVRHSDPKIVFP